MSKTIEEIGLIAGGLAAIAGGAFLMVSGGPLGGGPLGAPLVGIGVSTLLSGIGMALRPTNKPVGTANTISFGSGTSPRRVIYGQFQTAGVLTDSSFPASQNLAVNSQYLHLVYTLAGHEITSFDGVSVNGTVYNLGKDLVYGGGVGDNLWHLDPGLSGGGNDFYWQHMFFEFDFGRTLNGAQPFPALATADASWTSACLQRGCAKVHVMLRADASIPAIFPSGAIPNIQFLVTGKKIIDTRIPTAWLASTTYLKYRWILDNHNVLWVQTVGASGITGASRPNFEGAASFPDTLADGTASWTSLGQSMGTISAGFDLNPQGHLVGQRLMNDAWGPGAGWSTGEVIEAPVGYLQQSTTTGGVAGATEPVFTTTLGGTTSDNTQGWVCLGPSWNAINPSNPALIVNDYLQNTDWGMAAAAASMDFSSVSAAANVCEEQVLIIWNADNTVVYENQYAADGMFDHSSNRGDVLSSLCAAMAGWAVPPGDLWHVSAGSFQTPTIALGDGDMRGPIKGDFRLSRRDVCNSVKGKFTPAFIPANPAAVVSMTNLPGIWNEQSFPAYQANGMAGKPNYLNSEDGGQIRWLDLHLDFTTSLWMAQRLAKIALMRTRFQQQLTLPAKTTALQLEAGDTFSFTHLRWNISSQTFEVEQASISMEAAGGGRGSEKDGPALGVDIIARQTDPSIYEFQGPTSASDFGEYSPYGITGVMTGVE